MMYSEMKERWQNVPGVIGLQCSNHGRVRKWIRVKCQYKILAPRSNRNGYQVLRIAVSGVCIFSYVHQIICRAFHGAAPSQDHVVAHFDGNPGNNAPENVRWATAKENAADRKRHGRQPLGEKVWSAKITDADADFIRGRPDTQAQNVALAAVFGVEVQHIQRVRRGDTWRHRDSFRDGRRDPPAIDKLCQPLVLAIPVAACHLIDRHSFDGV